MFREGQVGRRRKSAPGTRRLEYRREKRAHRCRQPNVHGQPQLEYRRLVVERKCNAAARLLQSALVLDCICDADRRKPTPTTGSANGKVDGVVSRNGYICAVARHHGDDECRIHAAKDALPAPATFHNATNAYPSTLPKAVRNERATPLVSSASTARPVSQSAFDLIEKGTTRSCKSGRNNGEGVGEVPTVPVAVQVDVTERKKKKRREEEENLSLELVREAASRPRYCT
jgi:hypothetical protein